MAFFRVASLCVEVEASLVASAICRAEGVAVAVMNTMASERDWLARNFADIVVCATKFGFVSWRNPALAVRRMIRRSWASGTPAKSDRSPIGKLPS